jgi:hypothetical protein
MILFARSGKRSGTSELKNGEQLIDLAAQLAGFFGYEELDKQLVQFGHSVAGYLKCLGTLHKLQDVALAGHDVKAEIDQHKQLCRERIKDLTAILGRPVSATDVLAAIRTAGLFDERVAVIIRQGLARSVTK